MVFSLETTKFLASLRSRSMLGPRALSLIEDFYTMVIINCTLLGLPDYTIYSSNAIGGPRIFVRMGQIVTGGENWQWSGGSFETTYIEVKEN